MTSHTMHNWPTMNSSSLADVIDRVLDRGLVISADIAVTLQGVELLGVKIRAALASFETAARYGLEFPTGTNLEKAVWKQVQEGNRETCPQCYKASPVSELLGAAGCPWCGWVSARAKNAPRLTGVTELASDAKPLAGGADGIPAD